MEDAREKVTKAAVDAVSSALPGMVQSAMPEMPKVTGEAMPTGKMTGPAIPF